MPTRRCPAGSTSGEGRGDAEAQAEAQVTNLCYEEHVLRVTSEGLPVPRSRRCFLREARMAKRRKHRASEGQDARSERPAMGMGSPERRGRHRLTTCDTKRHSLPTCATGSLCYGEPGLPEGCSLRGQGFKQFELHGAAGR